MVPVNNHGTKNIRAIHDLARLDQLVERILKAQSWEDLLLRD
jgi:hypothetical protein